MQKSVEAQHRRINTVCVMFDKEFTYSSLIVDVTVFSLNIYVRIEVCENFPSCGHSDS